jgi:DNA-binding NarL/FixJ family response regulator
MSGQTFSVYILKSNASVLSQAETFLRNRNWIVGSGTNMREALAYIIQKQPQYVILSADHPNKKVKVLPKLLAQAFPVKVIAFAEKQSPSSMRDLNEMGQEYNLFPPVSGPSIERMILKIIKEEEAKARQAEHNKLNPQKADETGKSGSDMMHFHQEGINNASFEQARVALSQLVGSGDEEETPSSSSPDLGNSSGSARAAAGGLMISKGSKAPKGPAYMGGMGSYDKGPGYVPTQEELQARWNELTPEEKAGEDFGHWADQMKTALATRDQSAADTAPSGFAHSESDWQGSAQEEPSLNFESSKKWSPKQTPIMESEPVKRKGKRTQIRNQYSKQDLSKESIIVRGTQNALDETVVIRDDLDEDDVEEIKKSSNLACITVESPRFSGYLVCAMGKDRVIDQDFINMIQSRLVNFLKSNGEPISPDDTLSLKLQEVEFEDWAVQQAEFLRKSVHEADEVAMAFFPRKDLHVKLEESASEKMVKMTMDELKEDTPLEFDLYIFMPENNKYILYTPQGMPFYRQQKGRLSERGVTHMHLRKDSISGVKKYRAQNFLNEKIAAYKQAKKMKAS